MAEADSSRQNERLFGRHRLWIESEDSVFVIWNGDVLGEDIDVINDMIAKMPDMSRPIVLIQDVSRMEKFTSSARNKIIGRSESQRVKLVVVVGASFQVRMIQAMINRAMRLLHRSPARMETCDTMEQARALKDEYRSHQQST